MTLFEDTCDEVIAEIKKNMKQKGNSGTGEYINKHGGYQFNFAELNSRIQVKFNVVEEIRKLIYDHSNPNKFIYNSFTKKL